MKRLTRVALAAAAAALVLPVSGCAALLSAQQTHAYQYNGGDGAWTDIDDVAVRGLMLVAEDEEQANLFFTVVNNSAEDAQVEISVGDTDVSESVPAGETLVQNPANPDAGSEPITVTGFGGKPGSLVDVEVSVNGQSETVRTQVVSTDLPEYQDLAPTGGAASEPTAEPTGAETAAEEQGAEETQAP